MANLILNEKGQTPSQFVTHLVHKIKIATDYNALDPEVNHQRQISLELLVLREIIDEGWKLIPVERTI